VDKTALGQVFSEHFGVGTIGQKVADVPSGLTPKIDYSRNSSTKFILIKGKAIHVTGREGPQGYETSRIPRFL
jgi:hypothetical protein